ncbi:general odorant-binding protein 72-like [Anopheles bellator]|uniref:general odorant-binding protein 72-like n=2 Tax=Anopheles bellator TaxID=139047 RepID=UPI0026495BAB|nr:general odorant-binding protein 72-like [Anopheles bellator]XP_058064649.1 general odorant-binding protein 72-like [Anopheles bellator]
MSYGNLATSITMEQLQKTAKTFRQVCQPKHQITDAVADAVSNGVFTDTKQFKCYVSCLLEIMQVARRGKVNYEKSLRQIDTMLPDDLKSDFRTGLEACKNAAKDIKDHCEASYVLVQCFYKNNPKFIFP